MRPDLSSVLLVLSGLGFCLLVGQRIALGRYLRAPVKRARQRPPISILKPLCGLDDDLCGNLLTFVALDYPDYELLLGVKDEDDPAFPMARLFERRFPDRVRVVRQRGTPGLNPKVNQLVSLARAARHDVLVVSDSNIRVSAGYLDDIAVALEDPTVALVTHPISGGGGVRLGSILDNLHLGSYVAPGVIGARLVLHQNVVIGKSMALRRADLEAIGGFEAARDVLAEDHVLGRRIHRLPGRRVALGACLVENHSRHRSLAEFHDRYCRWAVLHRQGIGTAAYMLEMLLQPLALAALAALVDPSRFCLVALLIAYVLKCTLDHASSRALGGRGTAVEAALLVPLKDALLTAAWLHGLANVHVKWRGTRLRVYPGTWLHRPPSAAAQAGAAEAYG